MMALAVLTILVVLESTLSSCSSHKIKVGAPKAGCFDHGAVLQKWGSRGFRGLRGSLKYWNLSGPRPSRVKFA